MGRDNRSSVQGMPILLVSLAAAHSVLPGVFNTFVYGDKGVVSFGQQTNITATLIASVFALSIIWKLLLLENLQLLHLHLRSLGISLLPWGAYFLSAVINNDPINIQLLLYPLLMIYLASHGASLTFLRSIATCTMFVGLITLAYTSLYREFAILKVAKSGPLTQAFLTNLGLVAGSYSHPNLLGTIMCLGSAFSFFLSNKSRVMCNVICGVIVLLSGSRTSLICFTLIILLNLTLARSNKISKSIARVSLVLSGLAIIFVPLAQNSYSSFSGRTELWKYSTQLWGSHPIFGGGPMTYLNLKKVYSELGVYAYNGHNLFINTVTTLGIVGFLGLVLFISYIIALLWKIENFEKPVVVWLIAFMILSISEVRFEISNLSQVGFVTWFAFGYILFGDKKSNIL
jgi:O-antigen ligase